ncbi:MAG: toll/interleukin-1 receptor domain-containing protein [Opitutus sp.]|nr:toll/interleukin-1 receptor domain-containing protein [Opitutus sp.]
MSSPASASSHPPAAGAVFLSYAREDTAAAQRIAEALRSSGVEVWFDQSELRGGDAWDQKIRQQINDCTLFVPIISAPTEERNKGYFRLEWKLAVEQTHLMAEGVPFLAPVVVDDTPDSSAVVPPEFLRVQWTRLPGALPTPQFVGQIKRLLEAPHKAAPTVRSGTASRSASDGGAEAAPLRVGRRVPAAAWVAVIAAIASAAGVFWWRQSSSAPNTGAEPTLSQSKGTRPPALSSSNGPTTEKSAPPQSETRQLVAKARALYELWDFASHEDFNLAEQLLKRATELDPTDAEAWAAQSVLSCGFLVFNYDSSPARRDAARNHAERAVKLAPDSDLARFARAFSYRFQPALQPESVRLLREEAGRQPTNKFVVRNLGATLRMTGHAEEALVYLDRVAALPGSDAIAHYNRAMALMSLNRPVESEAALDQALALAPNYGQALGRKVSYYVSLHGDLASARALVEKIPPAFLLEDRGAATVSHVWLLSREPEKCIASLRAARDYIETNYYTGPKAYRTGLAHRMAGRLPAAQADWRAALQKVEQRLVGQSNSPEELGWKALLHALLGERAEAERVLQIYEQLRKIPPSTIRSGTLPTYVALGRHDEAIDFVTSTVNNLNSAYRPWDLTWVRSDPELDPLRDNPRFQALLKSLPPVETK